MAIERWASRGNKWGVTLDTDKLRVCETKNGHEQSCSSGFKTVSAARAEVQRRVRSAAKYDGIKMKKLRGLRGVGRKKRKR